MTRYLLALAAAFAALIFPPPAIAAAVADVTPGAWSLYVGTSKTTEHASEAACVNAAKALGRAAKYTCRTITGVVVSIVADPPPVVCPAASTATSVTMACPSGTTGTWTQTTTYTMGPPPACVQSASMSPAQAPDGACVAVPPPPPPPAPTSGPVFYVDGSAPNDSGTGTATSPKKCIGSGASLLPASGGGTLIIRPGTYSQACDALKGQGRGAPNAWNVIRAETDGTVKITAAFGLPYADHWLQFEGLLWDSPQSKGVTGRYVKILRSAFRGGPANDNTVTFGIGTNDKTPGAQYVLLEDVQAFGPGGRYNVLVYNSDKVVLRRVIARHELGWSDTKGDPQAAVSLYNSTDVLTQNLLVLDSTASKNFEASLYHPSNSRSSANIRNVGAMILTSGGSGVGWDDGATVTGMTLENSAVVKSAGVGVFANGGTKNPALSRVTIVGSASHGVANWSNGGLSIADSIVAGSGGEQIKGAATKSNVTSTAPVWLPRATSSAGAVIEKRLGKSGTLWGEAGFDAEQTESLWPWPQESLIKQRMCVDSGVTSGMCSASSITGYVWGLLGTAAPAEVLK